MAETLDIDNLSLKSEKLNENKLESTEDSGPTCAKIDILLKATGDAPIMKRKKWQVEPDKTIGWIINFVKKVLKIDPSESLFLYVNQSFAPSPDQIIKNLYDCFGSDGKLVLHYCKTQAWG